MDDTAIWRSPGGRAAIWRLHSAELLRLNSVQSATCGRSPDRSGESQRRNGEDTASGSSRGERAAIGRLHSAVLLRLDSVQSATCGRSPDRRVESRRRDGGYGDLEIARGSSCNLEIALSGTAAPELRSERNLWPISRSAWRVPTEGWM